MEITDKKDNYLKQIKTRLEKKLSKCAKRTHHSVFHIAQEGKKPFLEWKLKRSQFFTEAELENTGISKQGETRRPPHRPTCNLRSACSAPITVVRDYICIGLHRVIAIHGTHPPVMSTSSQFANVHPLLTVPPNHFHLSI